MRSSKYAKKMSDDSIDEDHEYTEKLQEEFDSRGEVIRVSNLTFLDGELGKGSYGTVRLAKRRLEETNYEEKRPSSLSSSFFPPMPLSPFRSPSRNPPNDNRMNKHRNAALTRSQSEPAGSEFFQDANNASPRTPMVVGRLGLLVRNKSGESERASFYADKYTEDDNEELVAVKIFRKSILKKMRTMERNKETRKVLVKTALMKVEREIAIMKKLSHPNLISLYDVLDSPESDMLYMVLEYMPLGEILTYQDDGTFRRKEPKDGKEPLPGLVDGHFDEETAALFFVDILHGLAYLHQEKIAHRDLKPENILLGVVAGVPVAKLGDFGVAHLFEDEVPCSSDLEARQEPKTEKEESQSSLGLTKYHVERALSMGNKSDSGLLTKTEGTWCFWSPEMCQGQRAFSGYACDMWAAGVCLYIFVSGRLPFFSDVPMELLETIAEGEVPYANINVSDCLLSLLKMTLAKDPNRRAGVGDCLQHPFLKEARAVRVSQLSEEFTMSDNKQIVIGEDDIRAAFQVVTRIPSVLIKSAAKQVESAGKRLVQLTRGASASSIVSDQSPVTPRSVVSPHKGISDTADMITSNASGHNHPLLPAIGSGSGDDEDDIGIVIDGGTPDSSSDRKGKGHHDSHHRRKKLFSTIFRRGRGESARELDSKNTC